MNMLSEEIYNKIDLRVKKTNTALINTLNNMLLRRNFNKITVNNLCAEARVSRATFYTHYNDKYDLLGFFLNLVKEQTVKDFYDYSTLKSDVNRFIRENNRIITNVIREANSETLEIVRGFLTSIVEMLVQRTYSDFNSYEYIFFVEFMVGGLLNLLMWLVDNNFPENLEFINPYLYKMLVSLAAWDAKQEFGMTEEI